MDYRQYRALSQIEPPGTLLNAFLIEIEFCDM